MATCGLWPGRLHLTAVVADDDGKAGSPLLVARTDDARWDFLQHLDATEGLDCELVVPEGLLVIDPIAELALCHGLTVWIAPWQWVHAIRQAAGLATGPPKRSAAMIARLPLTAFRAELRRSTRPHEHQLTMF
jgi:hypothetical protein